MILLSFLCFSFSFSFGKKLFAFYHVLSRGGNFKYMLSVSICLSVVPLLLHNLISTELIRDGHAIDMQKRIILKAAVF